ncbi:MAG: anhydro-N-acetylmuramic acid kinase, partial [Rhizobiaceae bacterium]
ALVRTDGQQIVEYGASLAVDYPAEMRNKIEAGLEDAKQITDRAERPANLEQLEQEVTDLHANAVNLFIQENALTSNEIDLIGFHGQTVLHRPGHALTVQLGDGDRLAKATGIDVVYDMRANDMVAGGQGAPLVPVFHQAIASALDCKAPICFVNIGGISNITYVNGDELIAFDTGPGNMLIDQWVQTCVGIPYDQGGKIASEGRINQAIVDRYMATDFFKKDGPKSLDRNDFPPLEADAAELSDGARTLARITATAIIRATDHLPCTAPPKTWVICGGGRLNTMIMADLTALAQEHGAIVLRAEEAGLQGDMLEAQAFAYLAVRSAAGLPLTFPTTTGCDEPVNGGVLARVVTRAT